MIFTDFPSLIRVDPSDPYSSVVFSGWRPQHFGYELFGCRVSLDFPVVKLLDYEQQWTALETDTNPFALVVMAQLQTHRTKQDSTERYAAKLQLTRLLYRKGYKRQDILELFRFIDWVLTLPMELDRQFWEEIEQFEAEAKMNYRMSFERLAIEEGKQEGVREMVLEVLQIRFGDVSREIRTQLDQIEDVETLRMLHRRALLADSLAAFEEGIGSDDMALYHNQ